MALTKAEQEAKAALEAKVARQAEQIAILESEKGEVNAALEAKVAASAEKIAILEAEKEQLLVTLEEQHKKMNEVAAKAATPVSSAAEIEVDGEKYEVVVKKFNYNGSEITVAQLLDDSELQKELVKIGAGVLKRKEIV